MFDSSLLTQTFFGWFLLLTAAAYGTIMILLLFAVRDYSFRQSYDRWILDNPDAVVPNYRNAYRDWVRDYNIAEDPNYTFAWGIATRVFSTVHAIIMVAGVCYLALEYGLAILWKYDFYFRYPDGMEVVFNLNAMMAAYLLVDLSFMIGHYLQSSRGAQTDDNLYFAVIHHLVGAICMIQFVSCGQVHFNSLYYAFTEISTVPLNIAWLALKLNWDRDPDLKIIYQVAGMTTWFFFLLFRIIGSWVLFYHLYVNINALAVLPLGEKFLAFVGNPIITGLNYFWFFKLSRKAFDALFRASANPRPKEE